MRELLSNLMLPLPVFWILAILSVWFFRKKKGKIGRILLIAGFLFLLAVSTPFIPNLLVENLEKKHEVFHPEKFKPNDRVYVLVLGGGHTNDKRLPASNQLSTGALARLAEGIRILNQIEGSTLVTSGWSGKREDIPQAEVLATTAILLGVDSNRIKKQILPKNTWMEATEFNRLFGDSANLILVTSAVHMPRAMHLFEKAGLHPVAAPTNHMVKKGKTVNPWFWLPRAGNVAKTEAAVHEYVGLLWYKLGGE